MEIMATLDYQQVINLAGQCIAQALPIGIIFGLSGKLVNAFLSMVLGKESVNL